MNSTNGKSARQFLDTNILVYAHDSSAGEKRAIAKRLVRAMWQSRTGCISVQVLQEFLVTVTRKTANPLSVDEAAFIISRLGQWQVHSPAAEDVVNAIQVQKRYQLSFWDALIIHSARQLNCAVVWSEDINDGQFYGSVQVRNPFLQHDT
ncbi:MAG TPA: PIN domain-containing protein [Anaerolineae bacterium]|nr:PIN domain-containing protein [Anaerolineae bacterium]